MSKDRAQNAQAVLLSFAHLGVRSKTCEMLASGGQSRWSRLMCSTPDGYLVLAELVQGLCNDAPRIGCEAMHLEVLSRLPQADAEIMEAESRVAVMAGNQRAPGRPRQRRGDDSSRQ